MMRNFLSQLPKLDKESFIKFIGNKYLIFGAIGLFLVLGIVGLVKKSSSSAPKIQVQGAKANQTLSKEFQFPLRDAKGEEVSKIKFVIENAELRDEIIVKGKRARSVSGRTFLILNLKLTNEYNQSIEINTKDYLRLSKNGDKEELLAPDVHNDPVSVQAISTKLTRVGFAINDSDKNLVIRVGEINGEKEEIALTL